MAIRGFIREIRAIRGKNVFQEIVLRSVERTPKVWIIGIMRTVTDHKLNGLNDALTITTTDEPDPGGANHHYSIRWANERDKTEPHCFIGFQNGPILEAGVNGVSGEALVAIVIDRLRSFQSGEYACRENAEALTHLETGLTWLQKRTRDRMARGVEGTKQK